MSGQGLELIAGARCWFDGELVQVVEFDGRRVLVRDERDGALRSVGLAAFAEQARAHPETAADSGASLVSSGLSAEQAQRVAVRAGHVREVLSGFTAGYGQAARPGEPAAGFGAGSTLASRVAAKAAELGLTERTIWNWVAAYRDAGEAGLADGRALRRSASRIDPRWDAAVRQVLAEKVSASTPSRKAVLCAVSARLDAEYGPSVVPAPSRPTAYRRLAALAKGTNAVAGSASGRRSIAARPAGVYGRLRASRPGEYVVLDTQDLDVYAMEPVTCRWVKAQLTVAQDLFSRCVVGLKVTPVSTKAVDVAGVLFEAVAPHQAAALAPYHGIPETLVFTEEQPQPQAWCPPETLVVDHGRAFLSAHVIGVCARLGISIAPAQAYKPTDKPTIERFFLTLREGLIQHLPAYKGPDIHARGVGIEDQAFLFLHELEDVIREWVQVYHASAHDGLAVAEWPRLALSPNEMFALGVSKAGVLRLAAGPELAFEFLAVAWRTIQHYGVEVDGLRYNGPGLDGFRNARSPFSGVHAGKWPIRVNPDDVRFVWFCDPDGAWHRLTWEHAALLDTAFSAEAAAYARRLAVRSGRFGNPAEELAALLERWRAGAVADRRERRMAVRLSAERAGLPDLAVAESPVEEPAAAGVFGDDDVEEELFDAPEPFEVLD